MFNTIKVNNTDTNYTHSIFDISEYNSGAIYANLSAALAAIPESKLHGGMSVKFIQVTPARYSVVKTENLETEPTGTLLSEAPYIDSGTYDENQLSTIFSTLPSEIGASHAVPYYVAVTVDETTTYTSWIITKVQNSVNKYVQYRLMATSWSTNASNWQSENVDEEPIPGSNNLVRSGGVEKMVTRQKLEILQTNENEADLDISDTDGNVILEVGHGHIQTKHFDSSKLYKEQHSSDDLNISDENGNVVLVVNNGHIKTKKFDSSAIDPTKVKEIEVPLANVYCIPCYGQSLAVNAQAGESTFSSLEPMEVDLTLTPRYLQDMCSGTVEGLRAVADYYNKEYPSNFKVVTFRSGGGGISVKALQRGSSYYSDLISKVTTAYNACVAAGLTMIVPCFTWTQGEEDMRCGGNANNYGIGDWDPFEYKNRLKTLIDQLNEDIKAITGQQQDVYCISYQTSSHPSYFRYPRIAMQQFDLSKDDKRMILASGCYAFEYKRENASVDPGTGGLVGGFEVHAPAKSYRHLGNIYGVAAYKLFIAKLDRVLYIKPIKFELDGAEMYIKFEVPYKPLVLDTTMVNNLPDSNYGFNVYNVDERSGTAGSITEATTRINNVELLGDDLIKLTFSRVPQQGETLTYAVNGDYWKNIAGTKVVVDGEVDDECTKAGYLHGSRGCLRDSQPFEINYEGAVYHKVYNWCPIFEYKF